MNSKLSIHPLLTLIIPCLNEEKYIGNCLDSILQSDYPKEKLEIFIVDGGSTDRTLSLIESYSNKYSFIKVLINKKKTAPHALNLGITNSSGEFIVRLDAHSTYPANYLSELCYWSLKLDADNVGAVVHTKVLNRTNISSAIQFVLSDLFGVGNSKFRLGVSEIQSVDTVPFGFFNKRVFENHGFFDTRLTRNQDIEFNKRIIRGGGRVYLVPTTYLDYYAREDFKSLALNSFRTGMWIIQTSTLTKNLNSLSLRHFIPLLFVVTIMTMLIGGILLNKMILLLCTGILAFYIVVMFCRGVLVSKSSSYIFIPMAFGVLHFSYGIGSIWGCVKSLAHNLNIKRLD